MPILAQDLLLEELHESPWNPRKHFPPKPLEELAESIREVGVLSPLLVRPAKRSGALAFDGYEIASGHRRYRAAKLAKLPEVPCIIQELDDQKFLEILTIENLQREDVHPLDEGEGYRTLMRQIGWDVNAVAARVGKSTSYVYQRLKLAELIPAVKDAFLAEKITAGHAILIARLQPKDQADALKYCEGDRWDGPASVRDLAGWIEREIHLDLHKAPWNKDDAGLLPAAGACRTCPKRTGFSPDLFPDVAKKDTCTDRVCFKGKLAAFIESKESEFAGRGQPLTHLADGYFYGKNEKGVLSAGSWREVKPRSCPHVRQGIVTQGENLGQLKYFCSANACKVHRGRYNSVGDPAATERYRKQQEADRVKLRREQVLRGRIVLAIRDKVKGPLGRADLELVVLAMSESLFDVCEDVTQQLIGWDPAEERPQKKIPTLSELELTRLVMVLALADLVAGYYSPTNKSPMTRLTKVAERYRVDVHKIEDQLKAEEKAKAAEAKTAAKAKGSGKTKSIDKVVKAWKGAGKAPGTKANEQELLGTGPKAHKTVHTSAGSRA